MTTELKKTIWTEVKENIGLMIAMFIIPATIVFFYGCDSKVPSILYPEKPLTHEELIAEVTFFLDQAKFKFAELEDKERIKSLLLEQAFTIAKTGTINPVALLTTFGSILGIGAMADNVRKRKTLRDNLTTYVKDMKDANGS